MSSAKGKDLLPTYVSLFGIHRAQEQAAAAGVKTIKPEHVLDALPELDWGEADTARLRKDLKKQLKGMDSSIDNFLLPPN